MKSDTTTTILKEFEDLFYAREDPTYFHDNGAVKTYKQLNWLASKIQEVEHASYERGYQCARDRYRERERLAIKEVNLKRKKVNPIIGKIICFFRGHQMFCDIPTHKRISEVVLQKYDTTTCQRMCGYKL